MKKILLYLILIMAITMAGTVAYVSVNGLLQVFTGAGTLGLMLFTAIEIAKIVATSAIHTYGKKIGLFYNLLLSLMVIISMGITSMGIYGFLSSSYKESFAKMENVDGQVVLFEKKRDGYQAQLDLITTEKESLNKTISELSKGLANNVIQYKDPKTGQLITTTSSSTRKTLEKQLDNAVIRQEGVDKKADDVSGKIFEIDNQILETKLGNDSANDLGTLKYLSDITGKSMDEVMKWFILLLIIIGDPMAVLMVIVFNKVVKSNDEDVEALPMDSLIGDKPKEVVYPEPMKSEEMLNGGDLQPEPATPNTFLSPIKEDYVKEIQDKVRREIPIKDVVLDEVVNEVINNIEEPIISNEQHNDVVNDAVNDAEEMIVKPQVEEDLIPNLPEVDLSTVVSEKEVEVPVYKKQPVITTGKIEVEDIREIKEGRGYSVPVPTPKSNTKERIGSNKIIKDGDNNKFFFKRDK
jgi:hypothetical protein